MYSLISLNSGLVGSTTLDSLPFFAWVKEISNCTIVLNREIMKALDRDELANTESEDLERKKRKKETWKYR